MRRRKRKTGEDKKKPWYASKGQAGPWRICKFSKCRQPNKETKYNGHCSVNCQKRKQIKKDTGYQFDLGHAVRSGWERRYAVWLRDRGIEYEYEPKTFTLAGGLKYMPDFYIPSMNSWVEVKGVMTEKDQKKIDLFRRTGKRLIVVDKKFFNARYGKRGRKKVKDL